MTKVTPEMLKAYTAWEPSAEVELTMPRVLGLLREAFYSGWLAAPTRMKLIAVDNFDRESIADTLIAENLDPHYAEALAAAMNEHNPGDSFYKAVPCNYRLSRGMADLV
jgi:hypothetical protein